MFSTKRVACGTFEVYWNGEKQPYEIFNGSMGLSGRDTRNMYGIHLPNGNIKWIGRLSDAKKMVKYTLEKKYGVK